MKITKNKIITAVVIIAVLAISFWAGGSAAEKTELKDAGLLSGGDKVLSAGDDMDSDITSDNTAETGSAGKNNDTVNNDAGSTNDSEIQSNDDTQYSDTSGINIQTTPPTDNASKNTPVPNNNTGTDNTTGNKTGNTPPNQTDTNKDTKPTNNTNSNTGNNNTGGNAATPPDNQNDGGSSGSSSAEPGSATDSPANNTCTLIIRCETILTNISRFNNDKKELLPEDGIIFYKENVVFYEGENVFNVLKREMKASKIQMEHVMSPIFNTAYIEGINNIYELDCGELSGWMYRVNGWFPNYGCSKYTVNPGDIIEWIFTCDLGADVGGENSGGNNSDK